MGMKSMYELRDMLCNWPEKANWVRVTWKLPTN